MGYFISIVCVAILPFAVLWYFSTRIYRKSMERTCSLSSGIDLNDYAAFFLERGITDLSRIFAVRKAIADLGLVPPEFIHPNHVLCRDYAEMPYWEDPDVNGYASAIEQHGYVLYDTDIEQLPSFTNLPADLTVYDLTIATIPYMKTPANDT